MKKLYLLLVIMFFSVAAFAQDGIVMVDEHFDGLTMPEGWAAYGSGTGNWSISQTNNAGASASELHLSHNFPETFSGTARFATPSLDLSKVNSIVVQFKFHLENYLGTVKIGIATKKGEGTVWHQGWQETYSTSGTYTVDQLISTNDLDNDDVLVAIYYNGNSEFFYDIYFDDIKVIALRNNDLSLNKIDILDKLPMNNNEIAFTVTNAGHDVVTNFEAQYYFADNEVVTEIFNTNMEPLATQTFAFSTKKNLMPDDNKCTLEITKVNGKEDEDPTNDILENPVFVGYGNTQRTVMVEHFSSCTCPHCPNADAIMATITANNPGKYTYSKYEMDWPGLGDPYYTEESEAMKQYYGVNAIPHLIFDSKHIYYSTVTQAIFDSLYASYAFADIKGSFSMSGTVINVTVDVTAHCNIDNYVLMAAVNEKTTTQNNRDEFHHVMMKMLPDPYGTEFSIKAMESKRFTFTQDMDSTFVEEMSDLEVAVWIQNRETKEILNSHFLYEYTLQHPYSVDNLQFTYNGDFTATASWSKPANANPTGYDVYVNGKLMSLAQPSTTYTFDINEDNYYLVEVVARYGGNVSVKKIVEMFIPMSIKESAESDVKIYPNPFDNQFVIEGNGIENIVIYNVNGQVVRTKSFDGENSVNVNIENLNAGIYFIDVRSRDGQTTCKVTKK